MNKTLSISVFAIFFALQRSVIAVDAAPHISDREIVESLTEMRGDIKRLEDGQKKLGEELQAVEWRLNKRMDDKFADLRSEMNGRFDDMNHRFDTLQWMFGLFVTIALVILGFVLRMQWQMHQRQTRIETVLETQRDELSFIKGIIEKLLPPKGML
ncbi:MAG: hypothetical protein HZB37_12480 [Planctomycetes bacterium]|nr:hypothetical protein [Planctomycetota bacterium]